MNIESIELKPCPFCGEIHNLTNWYLIIGYDDDGNPMHGDVHTSVDTCANGRVMIPVEIWNTRPIEDAQAKEIERLRAALECIAAFNDDELLSGIAKAALRR